MEVKRPRGGQRSRGFDLRWLSFPVGSQLVVPPSSREPLSKKRTLATRSQPSVSSRSPLKSHGGPTWPQPLVSESLGQPTISGRSVFVFGRSDRQIGTTVEVRSEMSFLEVASRSQSRPRGPDEQRETNERARMTNPVLREEKRNGKRRGEGEEPMETHQSEIRPKTEGEENSQTENREEMTDDTPVKPHENAGKCGRSHTWRACY